MNTSALIIIIPFASFICYCALFAILMGSTKNKITKYYTYYILAMIVWSFGSFIMRTNIYPGPLFWNRILCIGLIAMPVAFYNFALALTETTSRNWILYTGYSFAGVLITGNFFGAITKEAHAENNVFYYTLGPLASTMALWSICYMILALVNILNNVKSKAIPFIRVKYIIIGLMLVIIGGLLNLVPSLGKYPLDILSNTINAFFIAYSIYRYKFLEIKLIVKKGLAYSLYTLILTGLYIITIFIVQNVLSKMIGLKTITSALVVAVLLAFAFQPLKNIIQNWIDGLFYKEKLNHQVFLRDFSRIVNNVLDLDELADSLLESVQKVLKPKKVSLVLRHKNEEYRLFRCSEKQQWHEGVRYNANHPIVHRFLQGKSLITKSEIESSPYFTSLWSAEKQQLFKLEAEFVIAIKLREQLIGFLILSEKKGGEPYSQDEIDLVFTLMNNAAVVIENARIYEDAKQQAITDGLTKLYNHRHFHEVLREYAERSDEAFSIALLDVDFFKIYNDLYGHSAGDKALVKIADILRASKRKEDIVARYGGEEFAILIPGLEGEEAIKVTENIRKSVQNGFISTSDVSEFLTISIGVACHPRHGKNVEEVLKFADYAMYEAKRSGKNQSLLYSSQEELSAVTSEAVDISQMQDSIKSAYISAIYALAATIDARDHYTYGHSENVCRYAVSLATAAGFDEERIDIVKNSGLLHDIGKIGVPESILTKSSKLTPEEFDVMKKHVDISISIIKHVPNLTKVIPAILSHHERYDGMGYPRGIKGENIPLEGRCLCVVDAFDAMTSDRPYRKALTPESALEEIKRHSGTQFDPKLVEIFVKLFEEGQVRVA
jgi:diguanylate cyclase (GGDEF)-like protein